VGSSCFIRAAKYKPAGPAPKILIFIVTFPLRGQD
jgi:hypothetical protein